MRLFDYLPPAGYQGPLIAGQRIRVPFGKKQRLGVITAITHHSEIADTKLKAADQIIDAEPLLDNHLLSLTEFAADYYQHPPGEVIAAALPGLLRKGDPVTATECIWLPTEQGKITDREQLGRKAPLQAAILSLICEHPEGVSQTLLADTGVSWRTALKALHEKTFVIAQEREIKPAALSQLPGDKPPVPAPEQQAAIKAISAAEHYAAFLLEGVTGSGKTEVYLRCIAHQIQQQKQSLVLVPEIGLTPQLVERFRQRLDTPVAVLHSGLNDTERLQAWRMARDGTASVIIGTRSAIFTPLKNPGLIVIDEEHDASFKQQDGFRYSARDLAIWRARQLDIPVVLGSATPSFESLENADTGRYQRLSLPNRAGMAQQPDIRLVDLRTQPVSDGLTDPLRQAISRHLDAEGQVLIYLNRRGFSPALMCTGCGQLAECSRCDARLVYHQQRQRLVCHHCGAEQAMPDTCPECHAADLLPVGQGTERLENAVNELWGQHGVVRIDRDTTRRKGEIARRLAQIRDGEARILLGTQMLTKGHDFPNVTLVAIIDADQGLFGTDFRSSERLAQSFIQVAGRAGRGERRGEVYLQTAFPEHPLLLTLIKEGYSGFAQQALAERRAAGWPPYSYLALLRAEAGLRQVAFDYLDEAFSLARQIISDHQLTDIRLLGPAPAPMERRSGRYRGQLLLQAGQRGQLHRLLKHLRPALEGLKSGRKARWSLDIDPLELF